MSTDRLETTVFQLALKDIRLLPEGRNARFMPHEEFQRLVANIRRDGTLTSVPLVGLDDDGGYTVLSGNHRIMAALEALGPDYQAWVMLATPEGKREALEVQRALAVQLSHNAIVGRDDPAILAALYQELDGVDWRAYTGLDDAELDLFADTEAETLVEANLDFQTMSILFLPSERERLERVLAEALAMGRSADVRWVARYEEHSRLLDDMLLAGGARDVQNASLQLGVILDVFESHLADLIEPVMSTVDRKRRGWVPLQILFGTDRVPAGVAGMLGRAIQALVDNGDVPNDQRWQALEMAFAEFLAGWQPQS